LQDFTEICRYQVKFAGVNILLPLFFGKLLCKNSDTNPF
jgi:hypothetical protein